MKVQSGSVQHGETTSSVMRRELKVWSNIGSIPSYLPSSKLLFLPTTKQASLVEQVYFLRTMFDVLKTTFISLNFLGTFFPHQVWV